MQRGLVDRPRRLGPRPAHDDAKAPQPPVEAIRALQRSAGNAATEMVLRSARRDERPGHAFDTASSGPASALPHRERMEAAFGQSFAGVSAHVGTTQTRRGLARLGARAAAHGDRVAFADADPSMADVAHELAHVVQQRAGGSAVQCASRVSGPGDRAEQAAERAAAAVVDGGPLPDLGTADAATLHRTTVNTNGGVFDNAAGYTPVNAPTGAVNDLLGADISLDFTANDLVEAPANSIMLVQTVKSVTDRAPGSSTLNKTRDQINTAVTSDEDDIGLVASDGTAIDSPSHMSGRAQPNTHPAYWGSGGAGAAPATQLTDHDPSADWPRGSHVRDPVTGLFTPAVPAHIEDSPRRVIEVAGQTFEMTFEVTALVNDGPMENTYLGSVEWGWQSDAAGVVTVKPFVPLASGAPTATLMGAAGVWNAAEFHDDSSGLPRWAQDLFGLPTVPTVDLPITTLPSGVLAAVDMPTTDILARLPIVRGELAGLPAAPNVDRTNKEFELRALVTELNNRKIAVTVVCHTISDTGGAASPAEDEVWLSLDGGGSPTISLTGTRTFRAGDSHTFEFPVPDFMPLSAPVHVTINEHDRAGSRSSAHDDELIAVDWAAPFAPAAAAGGGGHYNVQIRFNR